MTFNLPVEYLIGTAIGIATLITIIILHKKQFIDIVPMLFVTCVVGIAAFAISTAVKKHKEINQKWEAKVLLAVDSGITHPYGDTCPKCGSFTDVKNILEITNNEYRWAATCRKKSVCKYVFIMQCMDGEMK